VQAVDLERDGWHERAGVTGARDAAAAGEGLLEELTDLAIRVGEVAGGGIAVVGW